MALTESQCIRRDDAAGKDIKTYLDPGTGDHIQAIALEDDSGNQTGISGNELHVQGTDLTSIITELQSLLTELQLKADLTETQPVSAAALPLPSGAATSAAQSSLLTELQLKADLTETQPVSAAALPLPSGAATSANQLAAGHTVDVTSRAVRDIGKVDVADIDGFASVAGQKTKIASFPVTLASDEDAIDITSRAVRDLGKVDIAGIDAIGTAAGQAAMAASLPVVIANNQSAIPVDATGQGDVPITLDGETVPVTGTFYPVTQPVSGTFWQATQPISAAALPVLNGTQPVKEQVGLVIDEYDYLDCTHVAGNLTAVVYKTGGAGGSTIATLALTYDGDGNLDTVTKT